jgi:hypothetical protein
VAGDIQGILLFAFIIYNMHELATSLTYLRLEDCNQQQQQQGKPAAPPTVAVYAAAGGWRLEAGKEVAVAYPTDDISVVLQK